MTERKCEDALCRVAHGAVSCTSRAYEGVAAVVERPQPDTHSCAAPIESPTARMGLINGIPAP